MLSARLQAVAQVLVWGLTVVISQAAAAQTDGWSTELTGHLKPQLLAALYPDSSLFEEIVGSESFDLNLDARFNIDLGRGPWDFEMDAQAITLTGDSVGLASRAPGASPGLATGFLDDARRMLDLTKAHSASDSSVGLLRLDRLNVSYTGRKAVLRLGRQAISWGNGFVFSPMDIFNPFDPTAVDKEYKSGDDMLYAQFSRSRGDDVQSVAVFRRDPITGSATSQQASYALKYHGLVGIGEYDLLVAQHYDETIYGVGGNRSLGGAVWQGDWVVSETDGSTVSQVVTGLSYSWVWGGKNFNGILEYFYNGFGIGDGDYSPRALEAHPDLLARLVRGELFNLGRNELALSATMEVTPLLRITPNLFHNLDDRSSLFQIVAQKDLQQDLVLQVALTLPVGPEGTEYGGITAVDGRFLTSDVYLSSDANLFLQLAWYF